MATLHGLPALPYIVMQDVASVNASNDKSVNASNDKRNQPAES